MRRLLISCALCFGAGIAAAEAVAIVSAKRPATTMSRAQVADVFLGKANRFPDGEPVVPIDQAEGSETRDEFYQAFANKNPSQLHAHWSKLIFTGRGLPPKAVKNGAEVKKLVAANPNAIGYIEADLVDASVTVLLSR